MSTARDGETTKIVDSFLILKDRLDYLRDHAQPSPHDVSRSWRQNLNESAWFLDLWEEEHIDVNKRALREGPAMYEEKVSRIRKRLDEAIELVRHCEYTLRISYPQASISEPRLTEDSRRHDCFPALERTLRELQFPIPLNTEIDVPTIAPSPSARPPSTPPAARSSIIATSSSPTLPSSRISPAYHEEHPAPREETQINVKQEHPQDLGMAFESPDQVHNRKDSHLSSSGTLNGSSADMLPGIHSFTQMPTSLTQVPDTSAYKPIFPPPVQHSPSTVSASSPQSPYYSGSKNGTDQQNDQQIVMMSPSMMLPPIQPRSSYSMPAMLTSLFPGSRPQSRPSGSSPER